MKVQVLEVMCRNWWNNSLSRSFSIGTDRGIKTNRLARSPNQGMLGLLGPFRIILLQPWSSTLLTTFPKIHIQHFPGET